MPQVARDQELIFTEFETRLKTIRDIDILFESILTYFRKLANADAGSIYEYESDFNKLSICYSQNDTLQAKCAPGEKLPYTTFSYTPTHESISGHCFLSKQIVAITDAYQISQDLPYSFNKETDKKTGYHTQSIITFPLTKLNGECYGILQLINAKNEQGEIIPFNEKVISLLQELALKLAPVYEEAQDRNRWINRLIKAAGFRDIKETGPHTKRVAKMSIELYDRYAFEHNIPLEERNRFRDNLMSAAKLHDVGKIGVHDKILKKPGILTDEERAVMKGHTCIGAQIFSDSKTEWDKMAINICLHHHDWFNGADKGYPGNYDYMQYIPETAMPSHVDQKLSGNDIPLEARIVALADVYDALRHVRCYKDAWNIDKALEEIKSLSGTQFDPELVDIFFKVVDRIEDIFKSLD